jgi:hypothetical protein
VRILDTRHQRVQALCSGVRERAGNMPDPLDRLCHQRFIYIIRIILEWKESWPATLSEDKTEDKMGD